MLPDKFIARIPIVENHLRPLGTLPQFLPEFINIYINKPKVIPVLREGTREDFAASNEHARAVAAIKRLAQHLEETGELPDDVTFTVVDMADLLRKEEESVSGVVTTEVLDA